jgi:hypothetical protein
MLETAVRPFFPLLRHFGMVNSIPRLITAFPSFFAASAANSFAQSFAIVNSFFGGVAFLRSSFSAANHSAPLISRLPILTTQDFDCISAHAASRVCRIFLRLSAPVNFITAVSNSSAVGSRSNSSLPLREPFDASRSVPASFNGPKTVSLETAVQTLAIATKTAFFAEMKFDMVAIPLRPSETSIGSRPRVSIGQLRKQSTWWILETLQTYVKPQSVRIPKFFPAYSSSANSSPIFGGSIISAISRRFCAVNVHSSSDLNADIVKPNDCSMPIVARMVTPFENVTGNVKNPL